MTPPTWRKLWSYMNAADDRAADLTQLADVDRGHLILTTYDDEGGEVWVSLDVAAAAGLRDALNAWLNPDRCAGLHSHYTGQDGADEWSAYDGAGHPLAGATVNDGRLFTHTHAEVKRWIADGGVPV